MCVGDYDILQIAINAICVFASINCSAAGVADVAGTVLCAALRAMATRSTLRLQATCNGPAFRQMDNYTYAL